MDVGIPSPRRAGRHQLVDVQPMVTVLSSRHLKVFRQTFVEPQRQVLQDRMQIAVRHFMAEIDRHVLAPLGINGQPRVGLDEERPPFGEAREAIVHERAEPLGVLEQIDVNRLVARRQAQLDAHIEPQGVHLLQQPVLAGDFEIAVDHKLIEADAVAGRQLGPRGDPQAHATAHRQQAGDQSTSDPPHLDSSNPWKPALFGTTEK